MNSSLTCETPNSNDWFSTKHIGRQQHQQHEQLSVEQLLSLMNQINTSVKASLFNAQLANQIFILCQQLKYSGEVLEQTHKSELNRIFVSLRQACCRDNGQLGTPCRLKMMELVELRAMAWRPSLAHTQYYLNRPEQHINQQQIDSGPVSAPPFGAIPVNPFSNFPAATPPIYMSSDLNSPQMIAPQPAPAGFYLIPAAGGWARPMLAPNMLPSGNMLPQLTQLEMDAWAKANKQLQQSKQLKLKMPPNRTAQLREEMVIRNSDSGKIMGVKGRRVAVVEELSKTIISFQKVDSKCKDRTLTITGITQEAIDYAKRLIEQTIRRNISPNRSENDGAVELEEHDDGDVGISIETTQDGTLKLSCADPQVLQAAQEALSEYLTRVGRIHLLTAEERELRKERRKSMPLQSSSAKSQTSSGSSSSNNSKWRPSSKTGSTPNLAQLNTDNQIISVTETKTSSILAPVALVAVAPSQNIKRYDRSQMLEIGSVGDQLKSQIINTTRELEIMRIKDPDTSKLSSI